MMKTKWSRWTAVAPLAALLMGAVVSGCGDGKDDTKLDNPNSSNPIVPNGKDDTKLDNPDRSNPLVPDKPIVGDPATTAKVKSALIAAGDKVGAASINVSTTNDGTVQLEGSVSRADQKKTAEMLAKGIAGVKRVSNKLVVKP